MMNKSRHILLLSLMGLAISFAQVGESDPLLDPEGADQVIKEQASADSAPKSLYTAKGSLSSSVHLLSQISEPNPNVKFSIVFPEYFGKDSQKNLLDLSLVQGQNQRVLIGLQNNGDEVIYVKNISGAFVEDALLGETPKYIQNFTTESFDGAVVKPTDSFSIAYEFFAFTSIQPKNYKLVIAVFYADSQYEYSNLVFNSHVNVNENDQNVGVTGLFSLVLSGGILFLFGFVIYVKVQDRFGPKDEGRRKNKGQGGVLGTLRDLISSQ